MRESGTIKANEEGGDLGGMCVEAAAGGEWGAELPCGPGLPFRGPGPCPFGLPCGPDLRACLVGLT